MRKRRLMSSLAVAAGLGIGGLAGVVLGVPGVSAAQTTTTTPPAADPGTPAAPATPDTPALPHDKGNCPNMGGSDGTGPATSGAAADATATGFRRGPRGGVVTTSL